MYTYTHIGTYVYIQTYTYGTTIDRKENHEFERDQGGFYGRVWMKEEEEGSGVIILQSSKIKQ